MPIKIMNTNKSFLCIVNGSGDILKFSEFLLPIRHAHKSAESLLNRFVRVSAHTHVKSPEIVKGFYEF